MIKYIVTFIVHGTAVHHSQPHSRAANILLFICSLSVSYMRHRCSRNSQIGVYFDRQLQIPSLNNRFRKPRFGGFVDPCKRKASDEYLIMLGDRPLHISMLQNHQNLGSCETQHTHQQGTS